MKQGETIADVQKRFTHIVNHLKGLGKIFEEEEINVKVLTSLNRTWQPKVTIIFESKNLMTHAELFRKLREYEIELTIMVEEEAIDKKNRGLALMTSIPSSDESEDHNAKGSDTENLNLLVRRFNKFLKKKKNNGNITFQPKKNLKEGESSSSNGYTWFECKETGHIKVDCPIYQKKQQGDKKNKGSFQKNKKTYISLDDDESTTSNDNSEDDEQNLCLMVNNEAESEVTVSDLEDDDNYDQLLDAFKSKNVVSTSRVLNFYI